MGQRCELQTRWRSCGHSSPPWAAATRTSKTRVWMPVPQVLEQAPHDLQEAAQSTAQGWALQLRVEVRD